MLLVQNCMRTHLKAGPNFMNKKTNLLLFAILVLSKLTVAQTNLYVTPDGNGAVCSEQFPCSLEGIKSKLRQLNLTDVGKVQVIFNAPKFDLLSSFLITSDEAGNINNQITFKSADGQRAQLQGGLRVTNWKPTGSGIYKAEIPIGIDSRQLYVNGKMAIRARYPNRKDSADFGPYNRLLGFDQKNKTIFVRPSELPAVKELNQVEMVINQHWYQSRVRISSIVAMKDTLVITPLKEERPYLFQLTYARMLDPNKPYYFENAIEFLDDESEWYINKQTSYLYYKPKSGENIAELDIVLPITETLIQVSGTNTKPVHNVTFENIEISYGTWLTPSKKGSIATQGVQIRGSKDDPGPGLFQAQFARNLTIKNCNVSNAGAHGIVFSKGVQNSSIIQNHIHEISANGIVIDTYRKAFPPDSLMSKNNLIADNLIENLGMHYTNGMGILASCVIKHIIEYNEIRNCRYTGMQIGNHYGDNLNGMRDNYIRKNNIHHVMQLHDDGGAIYTLSTQPGTKISENWIHSYGKSEWADNFPVNGIFLDNDSAYMRVERNVFSELTNVDRIKEQYSPPSTHDNILIDNNLRDEEIKHSAGIRK